MNTCKICGTECKNILCSSFECRTENMRRARGVVLKPKLAADPALVDKLMAQPEIVQLRPGIQTAIRAAFERALNGT